MPLEIERKFLVRADVSTLCVSGVRIVQGYLPGAGECTVRVRVAGPKAWLTMKGRRSGCCRVELEHEIGPALALELLEHTCGGVLIEKTRYCIPHAGLTWEVDVFAGANAGLILAEVELESPDQEVVLPEWVGPEVTSDPRYSNSALCRRPVGTLLAA